MRKLYLTVTLFCSFSFAFAQDPNFSQFFASPLTSNPALTGMFNGNYRMALNYRNQWPTFNNAFTTYTASFDARVLQSRISETDLFGIGAMAFSDKSGNGVLQNNFLSLSTAYHKSLDEDGAHLIGAGFQGTYVSKQLNVQGLHFEDMLRADGFTGITSESFSGNELNVSYFDLNAGLLYTGTTNGYNSIYFGASLYHLNKPKESFRQGEFTLPARVTLQAGAMLPQGDYNAIHFSANYSRQANATNTVIGGAYSLNLNPGQPSPTNLYLGTWVRLGDAVIPYVGLEVGELHFGATYDVNTSSLKPGTNMRGGAEFSLIYVRQPRWFSAFFSLTAIIRYIE
jgi:type IX secretion system PorP/SprF family membrane protein